MDIGNQQRVIIVEPEQVASGQPRPVETDSGRIHHETSATSWPLPLDMDQEHDEASSLTSQPTL
jgi:hypothetical protein